MKAWIAPIGVGLVFALSIALSYEAPEGGASWAGWFFALVLGFPFGAVLAAAVQAVAGEKLTRR